MLLGVSYQTVKRLTVGQRWYADELPAPVDDASPRRRSLDDVGRWLVEAERLAEIGALASIGSIGDSYDIALAESLNGFYETELSAARVSSAR